MCGMAVVMKRELLVQRRAAAGAAAMGFFLLAGSIAPLALGTDKALLAAAAPGLMWLFASLASLLGMGGLFHDDLEDGSLEVMLLSEVSLFFIAFGKACVFWLYACAPVVLAAVPIGYMFGLSGAAVGKLAIGLWVGTPALAFLGVALGAICAGLRQGVGFIIFLALPFFAPALIFGTKYVTNDQWFSPAFFYLAAFSLCVVALSPFATAAALRQHVT